MLIAALLACIPTEPDPKDTSSYFGGADDSLPPDTADDGGGTGDTGFGNTVPVYFTVSLDDEMGTIVHASWTLGEAGEQSWVEYSFDSGEWRSTPPQDAAPGVHEDLLLGIPTDTEVDVRVVVETDKPRVVAEKSITTDELPEEVPEPTLIDWDETRTFEANWVLLTIDGSSSTFQGPYYVEIIDRRGRVVWWHEVPDALAAFYNGVALDGTHLWFDASTYFDFGAGNSWNTLKASAKWVSSDVVTPPVEPNG